MTEFSWELLSLREPWWLLLALQPILMFIWKYWRTARQSQRYADQELLPWVQLHKHAPASHYIRSSFHSLAWLLLAISIAGPRIPDPATEPSYTGKSDILLLLDVSRSMQATDIRPNRLKRARIEVSQLLDMLQGERVASMVFSARSHLLHPFTRDYRLVRFYLENLQENLLPTEGSQVINVLHRAETYLRNSKNTAAAILLVTDGDLKTEDLAAIGKPEHPIYILAVGTEEGSPVPATTGGWLSYKGQAVYSATNRELLKKLAEKTNGKFTMVSDDNSDLMQLYQDGILRHATLHSTAKTGQQNWIELFPYSLLPALAILAFLSLPHTGARQSTSLSWAMLILFLLVFPTFTAFADDRQQIQRSAQQAYAQQQYEQSLRLFSQVQHYAGRMGEGSSAYQLKDYTRSIVQFTQAFLTADNDHQRADALYNLGNSHFKRKEYSKALGCFRDAILYNPDLAQAKANLNFTQSVIRDLPRRIVQSPGSRPRSGRGPRTGIDTNARSGSFVMDAEENDKTKSTLPDSAQTITTADKQIGAGRREAHTASGLADSGTRQDWHGISAQALLDARRYAEKMREHQSSFWKSLFESEEGFPAPVETPLPIKGVRPW